MNVTRRRAAVRDSGSIFAKRRDCDSRNGRKISAFLFLFFFYPVDFVHITRYALGPIKPSDFHPNTASTTRVRTRVVNLNISVRSYDGNTEQLMFSKINNLMDNFSKCDLRSVEWERYSELIINV